MQGSSGGNPIQGANETFAYGGYGDDIVQLFVLPYRRFKYRSGLNECEGEKETWHE